MTLAGVQETVTINNVEEHQHLPDANRLSILAATILLAYALTPFFNIPASNLEINLPGVVFYFNLNIVTIISLLVAALAAVGSDWIVRGHPGLGKQNTMQHWLMPALTAWVIGVPLSTLKVGPQWWALFAFGGLLLILVFVAEYIVVDLSDIRHAPATVGLTALSFALFLILAIAVRAAGLRLYLLLPALVIPLALVVLRTLYLRLGGRWCIKWAVGIAVVVGQIALGLHYLPVSPLSFGLIILGPSYAITSIAGSIEEGHSLRISWIEPLIMLTVLWVLAVLIKV